MLVGIYAYLMIASIILRPTYYKFLILCYNIFILWIVRLCDIINAIDNSHKIIFTLLSIENNSIKICYTLLTMASVSAIKWAELANMRCSISHAIWTYFQLKLLIIIWQYFVRSYLSQPWKFQHISFAAKPT